MRSSLVASSSLLHGESHDDYFIRAATDAHNSDAMDDILITTGLDDYENTMAMVPNQTTTTDETPPHHHKLTSSFRHTTTTFGKDTQFTKKTSLPSYRSSSTPLRKVRSLGSVMLRTSVIPQTPKCNADAKLNNDNVMPASSSSSSSGWCGAGGSMMNTASFASSLLFPASDQDSSNININSSSNSNNNRRRDNSSSLLLAHMPSSLQTRSVSFSSLATASSSSMSTFLASLPRNCLIGGGNSQDYENGIAYTGPTTLSSFKLIQGSVMMFVIMAFVNFIVGSYLMAFHGGMHSSSSSSSGTSSSHHHHHHHHLQSHYDLEYDAHDLLSTEVIYPLSQYNKKKRILSHHHHRQTQQGQKKKKKKKKTHVPKGILGSAVLSSMTEWLSPILPFVGGMDLRRLRPSEAYACFRYYFIRQHATTMIVPPSQINGIPRGGGGASDSNSSIGNGKSTEASATASNAVNSNNKPNRAANTNNGRKDSAIRPLVLAASEPFMPIDDIAELTLEDVAQAFQANQFPMIHGEQHSSWSIIEEGGGEQGHSLAAEGGGSFTNERLKNLIREIANAASQSRGEGVLPAEIASVASSSRPGSNSEDVTHPNEEQETLHGNIDASQFCAALRIFAEWRMLRTVPEGYKGYSVGMTLGHKDVVQNVAKIETVMREWIERQREELTEENEVLRGPTLRQLLVYERDHHIHTDLPRLKDNTAAMGLLWSSRQLRYQTAIFQNILDTPVKYPDTKTAVGAAYQEVYDKFHGWTVQKIFNYSFKAAPEASLIYNTMYPKKLEEIVDGARNGIVVEEDGKNDGDTAEETLDEDEQDISNIDIVSTFTEDVVRKASTVTLPVMVMNLPILEFTVNTTVTPEFIADKDTIDSERSDARKGNIWINIGHHIANEWTKLGQEANKLRSHVDGELNKAGNEWDKVAHKVVGEWDKIITGIFGNHVQKSVDSSNTNSAIPSSPSPISTGKVVERQRKILEGYELELHISLEMERHVHEQISVYLRELNPILAEVVSLFDEMNMDDPSKV